MKAMKLCGFAMLMCTLLMITLPALSQSTISSGSIQGTVVDPNGAFVPGAAITITNKATGQVTKLTSNSSGTYASGTLQSGEYEVRVETKGFQTELLTVTVQVGVTATGNVKLAIGKASEVVEVAGSAVNINTEQATVQGVLNAEQIENLPINGRNFLDLAQLEPGVQIQDGGNFDPTKNGFSSISFGGRFGRTARIEVDGIDISDETVGTTTQNLPASAIQEFQVSQSSLDLSTELTSSGAVNVVTKSGTNKWHGQGFYLFRDHSLDAKIATTDLYFQRNNFGGNLGGPIIKDKLFFFADAERLRQVSNDPVVSGAPFTSLSGNFSAPFRDTNGVAKLDYHLNDNYKIFYRFSYEQNSSVKGFIPNSFQPFANVNHTPVHVVGLDFSTGSFTHQVRVGFTKFRNGITDATQSGVLNLDPRLSISLGPVANCLTGGADAFCSGTNFLAPQQTYQQNTQVKYDGSKILGTHILRYGVGFNHIQGGGFAKFVGIAPIVNSLTTATPCGGAVTTNCINGDPTNPLNYPVQNVILGNGQGFSSEKAAFGLPGGGLGPDNRLQLYVGDSWKFRPNLTLTYGLRYIHDTGRTDSDVASLPCSTLAPALAAPLAAAGTPCTTNIGDLFGPGLGKPVRDPGINFAPNFGFAWRPRNSNKTVVRGGIGLYYENSIYNNNLFDRPGRLAQGLFLATPQVCQNGVPNALFTMPDGSPVPNLTAICGAPISSVAGQIAQLQQAFQAATVKAGPAVNSVYLGNTLADSVGLLGTALLAPNYQTPRSVQLNFGFERQLGKGVVWSGDYIRNVSTHTLLAVDVNHVGDKRFFNKTNALNAITATNNQFGCGTGNDAASINCAIAAGATIASFAGNGLDSGTNLCFGSPCPNAAFPGQNPNLGVNQMLFPAGRSVYNALETSLRANVNHPFKGVRALSWQTSYALSRYESTAQDSDFINNANDNNRPAAAFGPNGVDRTHQLSFGGTFDFPGYLRFGVVSHVDSPLPLNLTLPPGGAGGIFISDPTGSGTNDGSAAYLGAGGIVPGTNLGAYGRDIKPGDLGSFITNYNNTVAGTATPAGQALINSGVITLAQLKALGAVFPTLQAPLGQVGLGWLKTFDFRVSYPRPITEAIKIEPSVSIFNAFNMSNFDLPGNTLSGILAPVGSGPGGSVNSVTTATRTTRVGVGSGVFDLGAPRVIEFGLKVTF